MTQDISPEDGRDVDRVLLETEPVRVEGDRLEVTVPGMNKFTRIDFIAGP